MVTAYELPLMKEASVPERIQVARRFGALGPLVEYEAAARVNVRVTDEPAEFAKMPVIVMSSHELSVFAAFAAPFSTK